MEKTKTLAKISDFYGILLAADIANGTIKYVHDNSFLGKGIVIAD